MKNIYQNLRKKENKKKKKYYNKSLRKKELLIRNLIRKKNKRLMLLKIGKLGSKSIKVKILLCKIQDILSKIEMIKVNKSILTNNRNK